MAKTIYFNTKTNATAEMTQKELSSMKPDFRKRWREATEAEIKIHEKREEQKSIVDKHNADQKKKNEKRGKVKAKSTASTEKKDETPEGNSSKDNNGSDESADS